MRGPALAACALACHQEYQVTAQVDVHPSEVTECAFEEVEGAPGFERYTCNPVFTATDEGWADDLSGTAFGVTEVLGHPFYQLWYFASTEDGPRAGYATSDDGTSFQPHPDNPSWPEADPWDDGRIFSPEVAWDPEREAYIMLYTGMSDDLSAFGLGVAVSADGWRWSKSKSNPVVDLRLLFGGLQIAWPMALEVRERSTRALVGATEDGEHIGVWQLATEDVSSFHEGGEEIFGPGRPGDFDDQGFVDAAVAEVDGVEHMFYVGFGAWETLQGEVRETREQFLGHATSDDGERWERDGTGPVPIHLDPDGRVSSVAARAVGSRVLLWVSDWYPELEAFGVGYFVYTPPGGR